MKKILLFAVAMMAAVGVQAQNFPVGIMSGQDSVKSVQFGVLSSVAVNGGKGFQYGTLSNVSGGMFSGLQLAAINNITRGMNKGLQLSALLPAQCVVGEDEWLAVRCHQLCRLVGRCTDWSVQRSPQASQGLAGGYCQPVVRQYRS